MHRRQCARQARVHRRRSATGDFSPLPSPTPTCLARAGPAPPRAVGPGVDIRFRRRLVRAAVHRMHARRHAPGGAGHSGTRHHAGGALCRSPGPDSAVGTAAKCVWTGRAWRLSSASSVRRTGTAMACIDTATHRHRREGCTPSRLNGDRDGSVLGATLIERSGVEPRAVARHRRAGRCVPAKADSRTGGGARTGRRRRQRRDNREGHTMRKKVRGNNRLCRFSGGANPSPTALFYSR